MSKLDFMNEEKETLSLNKVLSLWQMQVKKLQSLLEMNDSFPDGKAYNILLDEFHVLERLGKSFANSNFLIDSSLVNAVNKMRVG